MTDKLLRNPDELYFVENDSGELLVWMEPEKGERVLMATRSPRQAPTPFKSKFTANAAIKTTRLYAEEKGYKWAQGDRVVTFTRKPEAR